MSDLDIGLKISDAIVECTNEIEHLKHRHQYLVGLQTSIVPVLDYEERWKLCKMVIDMAALALAQAVDLKIKDGKYDSILVERSLGDNVYRWYILTEKENHMTKVLIPPFIASIPIMVSGETDLFISEMHRKKRLEYRVESSVVDATRYNADVKNGFVPMLNLRDFH